MLPEGWCLKRISEIGLVVTGNTPSIEDQPPHSEHMPFVTPGDLGKSRDIVSAERTLPKNCVAHARPVPEGSILVTCIGSTIGKVGLAAVPVATNQQINAIVPHSTHDPEYIYYQIEALAPTLKRLAGTQAIPLLNKSTFSGLKIAVPAARSEELSIARVLSTWDKAIATTEKLLANSCRYRKALTTALFREKRRLPGGCAWQKRKISDLIAESRIPGSTGDTARKITVKLYGRGVVSKSEKRMGSDATRYYRRKAGQFIYSKLDFLNGAFGIIPPELDGYESTLDLPAFDFLDGVDPRWFLHYISREDFYLGHLGLANGGRKARRVNPNDLLQVSIEVPEIAEQRVIAEAIDTAIADEKAQERMVAHLKAEKRVLMDDLLTGKRRVPAWSA